MWSRFSAEKVTMGFALFASRRRAFVKGYKAAQYKTDESHLWWVRLLNMFYDMNLDGFFFYPRRLIS